jgi:exopolysaccharide production protein ExoY
MTKSIDSDHRRQTAKRIFDILFSALTLILFVPFGVAISFLIKISSKGPVFYKCNRIGKGYKEIYCWKFRTMDQDAAKNLSKILSANPQLKEEWQIYHKLKKDPRITPIGRFLRKTSLDEFPQFWNVLKGDLSVVGPRPSTKEEIEAYCALKSKKILSIRPGLTGIWQTSGRSLLNHAERVFLDEKYVELQSLCLDLLLIGKTIPLLFFNKTAF